jgi:hypothetical protein
LILPRAIATLSRQTIDMLPLVRKKLCPFPTKRL